MHLVDVTLSFIHMSQFFLGKFIPVIFLLNPNYANLIGGKFSRYFFSKWKKTEISACLVGSVMCIRDSSREIEYIDHNYSSEGSSL